ncbi:MAG: pilQ, partial [Phycisphaerales bacterium]|nr:pilQ [Phycisphaerales bacterium]
MATAANSGSPAARESAGNVRTLDDVNAVPATQPAPQPTTKPASQGQSVTAAQVNVSDLGTVEIHVNDAALVEVLRMLSLQSQKNIVASKDVRGTITANLYDVTVREALDAILHANGYDYREKGNFIFVYTAKELADMEKQARQKKTEVFRLFYTPAANAVNIIKPVLSSDGQVAFTSPAVSGIDTDSKDVGGNSHATEDVLVVTDYPENLDAVRKVLKEIDRRPQQILVEATILRASLHEDNALGVDFTALGGVDFGTLANAAGGSTGGTTGGTTSGGSSSSVTGTGTQQALSGSIIDNPAASNINHKGFIAGSLGGNGLKLGVVKDSVGLFVSALEGVTDTVVLANPKVLVLNKQKGVVQVGSEQGYKTAITTETTTAQDVKFLATGTLLMFRPYVGENGFIRMEIHPEDSSGSVNDQGLPNKSVTQVTTNVMVKDGHTIVIGGLFRDSTIRARNQVPGLGSLPGVGAAFRNQSDTTDREEVIILLTPHIVKDESAYTNASEQELKEAERIRVGMRRGLMPWGRERLAESWYENAVKEMNKAKPDREKALFHLNCAINLHPEFTEAIEMRSQVTNREMRAMDNSTIRYFLRKQVLAEQAHPGTNDMSPPASVPIDPPSASQPAAQAVKPADRAEAFAPKFSEPTTGPAEPAKSSVAAAPATHPATSPATPTNVADTDTSPAFPDTV